MNGAFALDTARIRDLTPEVMDDRGRMRVLPMAFWQGTTVDERALFGHTHGIYGFPTIELVEYLRELIGDRSAIEIGAGHGVLAEALGIPATDNKMQNRLPWRRIYELTGQPPVRYGRNVTALDAAAAIRRHRPEVVIGSWVTHRYDPRRHWAGGNEIGVDEAVIVAVADYVSIGNEEVHAAKAIWDLPHTKLHAPFVFSRAANGSPDFIATWPAGSSR